jgi:hypothetical protein
MKLDADPLSPGSVTTPTWNLTPFTVHLKGYADGREARAGIGSWIAFYNGRRPHQATVPRWPSGEHGMRMYLKNVVGFVLQDGAWLSIDGCLPPCLRIGLMATSGVRCKGGAFQWVQTPPGNRSSRKQSEQSWSQRSG